MTPTKINLSEKFGLFSDHWSPKILGQCNNHLVKVAKVSGEFIWHDHEHEDELFLIRKGTLYIEFRDQTIELLPGEMLIVPQGVEHRPYTLDNEEVELLLFEPIETKHTGDVESALTQETPQYL